MNVIDFHQKTRSVCRNETSYDPENWTEANPFYGHCAIIALLAQDIFGGKVVAASLENTPFAILEWHFWNLFDDGEKDFTEEQFKGYKIQLIGKEVRRETILSHKHTVRRYELLRKSFLSTLNS